jgi:predicted CXXCH cytochrome family protein
MARSFFRPRPENIIEDYRLNNKYYHRASDTHFEMLDRNGKYYQRRYQIGFDGKETNVDEKEVDFVMGSGNHVRTYLHRTNSGALLELPLAWYAENGGYWAMNPGYDKADQENSRRKISYECMFCHNAYPEIPAGHDQLRAEPAFAGALPQGIDCQRCHGPGREHIRLAHSAKSSVDAIRSAIVNPARLTGARQMEVCIQCHLETTSIPFPHSITKYNRGPFSYLPGQPLGNFMLFFDRAPAGAKQDRVEIVNSVYRLRMSACFLKSSGALQCTTCHDPHDIPHGPAAAQHYNGVCLQCHGSSLKALVRSARHTVSGSCVECHMPKRRTSDVVHAIMTDHYIQRSKPEGNLLAEIPEPNGTAITYRGEVFPYYPEPFEQNAENELYLALAQVRSNNNLGRGVVQLAAALEKYRPGQAEFYIELADVWLRTAQVSKAIPLYEEALQLKPDSAAASMSLLTAFEASGQPDKAIQAFQRAVKLAPDDALLWQELGQVYMKQGQTPEAVAALKKSLELNGEVPQTHQLLGTLWTQRSEDVAQAEGAYREAIRLQPDYAQARTNLAILLFQRNRVEEAGYQFEYALRLRPDYALGHFNYGLMLWKTGNISEARRQMEATIRVNPNHGEAHQVLGKLAELSGDPEVAFREYSEAVRSDPQLREAQLGLGVAFARKGDRNEAAQHLREAALSSDPNIRQAAQQHLSELGVDK